MSKLDYTEIKSGVYFKMDGVVYETIDSTFSKKSRQKGSNQIKIKNLITGSTSQKTLHASDVLNDVDIEKGYFIYLFKKGSDLITIHPEGNPKDRKEIGLGNIKGLEYIPTNTKITAVSVDDEILTIELPIKVEVEVKEAPPTIKGNTSQGGTKQVVVETGAIVKTPLFIETADKIIIKPETGEYIERSYKA